MGAGTKKKRLVGGVYIFQPLPNVYKWEKKENATKRKKRNPWYPLSTVQLHFSGPFQLLMTSQDLKTKETVPNSRRHVAFFLGGTSFKVQGT